MKKSIIILAAIALLFGACKKNEEIKTSSLSISVNYPEAIKKGKPTLKSCTIWLENVNTGQKIKKEVSGPNIPKIEVEDGVYHISFEGIVSYETLDASGKKKIWKDRNIRGSKQNVVIKDGHVDLPMEMFLFNETEDTDNETEDTGNETGNFVISEIFFTGSKRPNGKGYSGDQFFEIYNNSSKILYADGLCIGETEFNTALIYDDMTPNIIPEKVALHAVYRIPGNGKEHPVKPGESIVLCDVGLNHKEKNPSSPDLSKANFEWYDKHRLDVDVPEVPNMEKVACYTKSIWRLHNRGLLSYVIFKLNKEITPELFAKNYAQKYSYKMKWSGGEREITRETWAVPNKEIIDAVECSAPSKFKSKSMSPTLDFSWTHSGDADDYRYGKSVKRRIDRTKNGRIILMDTNDSAKDFIATAKRPSPGSVEDHK